jgi:hypothetical protein
MISTGYMAVFGRCGSQEIFLLKGKNTHLVFGGMPVSAE